MACGLAAAGQLLTALVSPPSAFAETSARQMTAAPAEQDIQVVDSDNAPWPSIGRVNVAGYRRTFMCTGTLIAPNIVLTAAHCLYNRFSRKPFAPKDVIFLAGVRRDLYSARLTADCFRIHADYEPSDSPQLKDIYSDVALIILKEPTSLPSVAQVDSSRLSAPPRSSILATAGYHRDRRFLPTFDPACKIIGEVSGSWLTDCASKQGASGGPVFIRQDDRLEVAAVMSATAGKGTSVVVPRPHWQRLLDTASCQRGSDSLIKASPLEPVPLQDEAIEEPLPFGNGPATGMHESGLRPSIPPAPLD